MWSEGSIGHGLDCLEEGLTLRRRNANTSPEGFCIAVAAEPMATEPKKSGGSAARDHYGEVRIENDSPTWSSGLDFGFTVLTPKEVGQANERGLAWAEFENTWVLRSDGQLRFQGRAYPPGHIPGMLMRGWNTSKLEMGDTVGLQVPADGTSIIGWVNGERAGCIELDEKLRVPTNCDLYLIADIVSRASEVTILEASVPK